MDYVELNDLFFKQTTVRLLEEQAEKIVDLIDYAKLIDKYKMTRKYISLDADNQYFIIGRNLKNLFDSKENLFSCSVSFF